VRPLSRSWSTVVAAAAALSLATFATPAAHAEPGRGLSPISAALTTETGNISPELRVDQVGYTNGTAKVAYLMLPGRVRQVSFSVEGPRGVVFRG
jgi:hypothetical protein